MRRLPIWIFCGLVLATAVPAQHAAAQTSATFRLQIGDRYRGPDLGFYDEPDAYPVRGARGVYYVRDARNDVYRYGNSWYMNYNGDWYRASSYRGPWLFVSFRSVPREVYMVPARYRRNWRDYRDRHYYDTGYRSRYGRYGRYGRNSRGGGADISLRIGERYRGPDLGFYDMPNMVRVPGYGGVYYVQDSDYDVYRAGNYWYLNYSGDWYRASSYRGPWIFVGYRSVPQDVYTVPSQYRRGWNDYRDRHYQWSSSSQADDSYYNGDNNPHDRGNNNPYDRGNTRTSVTLRIGDRYRGPSISFTTEPDVMVVPGGRGVYYVQDSDADLYRYGSSWYMNYNGDWYRAGSYNGPWVFVGYRSVPREVYSVPTGYRRWSDMRDQHYDWNDQN